ncbi:MAG: hypothetical protein U1E83_02370 [Methylotetracoccus sp.]
MHPSPDSSSPQGDDSPRGTWLLLSAIALAMTAAWLFLYFGVFLPRGSVQ